MARKKPNVQLMIETARRLRAVEWAQGAALDLPALRRAGQLPAVGADQPVCHLLARLDVIGIELEHALEQLEGARGVLELGVDESGRLGEDRHPLEPRPAGLLGAQQALDRPGPGAARLVQLRGRPQRREVLVVDRQRPLEVALGGLGVALVLEREPAGLGPQRRAVRVGIANNRNPVAVIVPCHRVIGSQGALTGYAGGLARKRWLLEHEAGMGRQRN